MCSPPPTSHQKSRLNQHFNSMKTLTDADIVQFYLSWELPRDPREAERLLRRIKEIADTALLEIWNN